MICVFSCHISTSLDNLYPFSVHVVTFTFHYQLMHLLIKTLSQFTFKTTHVKNVCDAYLKLILKTQRVSVSPPTISRGQFPYLTQLLRVSLPASSHSSLWRYVVCMFILAMYLSVWCLDVYCIKTRKYASQTFLTCVVLHVNCESVLINKCMSW